MEDLDLPEIKRRKIQDKKIEDKKEFKDLFQSDSSSDEENGGLKIKGEFTLQAAFLYHSKGSPLALPVLASRGLYFVTAFEGVKFKGN